MGQEADMIKGGQLENRAGMPHQEEGAPSHSINIESRIEKARVNREGELERCDNHARYSACATCYRRGRDAALRIIDGA